VIVIAVVGGLCVEAPCLAETIEVESHIVAVTVFPDRAGVTRQAHLTLPQGAHTVKLSPLPSQVEPDSVTAKGMGEAEVTLYGVRLVTTQLQAPADAKVKTLEEDIRKITYRQQRLRNTRHVLEQERTYLNSIQAASGEQIGKDLVTKSPTASDAASLLTFLDEALLKNFERDQAAVIELDELAQQLDQLQRELAVLTQGRDRQETAILVDLEARKAGSFQLEVAYRIPGATWQPTYEARASTDADIVEVVSYGLVRQQTGEEWAKVQLTLSTARPALAGSMPELQSWFLRPWQPYERQNSLKMARGASEFEVAREFDEVRGDAMPAASPAMPAQMAYATVATQGPSVTFQLPKPESIPADWQPHKVPVSSARLAANRAYETTPALSPYAFLRAKVTNTTGTLYLAGPVSVFLDGAFVATATLKQTAPNETADLYLGVDERIKVERKPLKERVEVSLLPGLRGKTKTTDYEFLTTVENFTGRQIAITVFDRLPVSEREEIVVDSIKQAPADVEKDPEKPGVFHWTLRLDPNQKQALTLSYRVRHPVEMQIQ
jgi:uncharacterized protein (TIGR02231 family)